MCALPGTRCLHGPLPALGRVQEEQHGGGRRKQVQQAGAGSTAEQGGQGGQQAAVLPRLEQAGWAAHPASPASPGGTAPHRQAVPMPPEKQTVSPPSPRTAGPTSPLQLMSCLSQCQSWMRQIGSLSLVGAMGTGTPLVPALGAVHN